MNATGISPGLSEDQLKVGGAQGEDSGRKINQRTTNVFLSIIIGMVTAAFVSAACYVSKMTVVALIGATGGTFALVTIIAFTILEIMIYREKMEIIDEPDSPHTPTIHGDVPAAAAAPVRNGGGCIDERAHHHGRQGTGSGDIFTDYFDAANTPITPFGTLNLGVQPSLATADPLAAEVTASLAHMESVQRHVQSDLQLHTGLALEANRLASNSDT